MYLSKGNTMKSQSIIVAIITAVALTYLISFQTSTGAAQPPKETQWEYGIYQVGESRYAYEWVDRHQHIYGTNQQDFFEKMGMSNLLNKISSTYINTSAPYPPYLVDTAFINQLGHQGWELVEGWGFQKQANHVFTFKRPIQ